MDKIVRKIGDDKLSNRVVNINKEDLNTLANQFLEVHVRQILKAHTSKEEECKRVLSLLKKNVTVSKI